MFQPLKQVLNSQTALSLQKLQGRSTLTSYAVYCESLAYVLILFSSESQVNTGAQKAIKDRWAKWIGSSALPTSERAKKQFP